MTKEKAIKTTKILSVVFIILGVVLLYIGFSKINKYENPEYSWEESINAYVGGDAYNYIINGTYFTSYSVMGTGSLIIASIMGGITIYLSIKSDEEISATEKLPEI